MCKIGRNANERFRQKTACILEEKYKNHTKIYTNGSKKVDRVSYAVIWNHQKITKRVRPQNKIFSTEQSAIITAIHSTIKEPGRKLIATDSLSTLVAASDKKDTKTDQLRNDKPKTTKK
jgi:hypothetical protein